MKDTNVDFDFASGQRVSPLLRERQTDPMANPDALIIIEMLPHTSPEALRMARAMITGQG